MTQIPLLQCTWRVELRGAILADGFGTDADAMAFVSRVAKAKRLPEPSFDIIRVRNA